ncbi:hypothetical protein ABDK00_014285 [Niabella insulamsoli]|uniref:hypothetical protein n=1 Tax=Niabella insulamsoli TaxID=3144874 RepID=UPI003D0EC52E
MLLIFAISSCPKRYLHDIFANHIDFVAHTMPDGKAHVSQSGFQCDCNSLVATSPFTAQANDVVLHGKPLFCLHAVAFITAPSAAPPAFIDLRGPPSMG